MIRGRYVLFRLTVCLLGLWVVMHVLGISSIVLAADVSRTTANTYAIPLEQLRPHATWRLHGVDGRRVFVFGIRGDQDIKKLEFNLTYRHSPALINELSHLNVLLNGDVVTSLPMAQADTDVPVRAHVDLPHLALQDFNYLELQAVSHYTMGCEDPLHESLWVDIDRKSQLIFHATQKMLPNDLNILPSPFFDERDVRRVDVPFVLARPSDIRLEAAGIVASWFGALASHRGARFSVLADAVPPSGNAVIVLGPDDVIPGVELAEMSGPTIALRANPHDPAGKLLIVSGRSDKEIRSAAVSLAVGGVALSGPTATIHDVNVLPRKPYDAPNWLAADRPVALGELLPEHEFTVEGFDPSPITLGLRLPPGLSDWHTQDIDLNLRFRHSAWTADQSTLDVMVNQERVWRIDLASQDEAVRQSLAHDDSVVSRSIPVPLAMLGSKAGLAFQFSYPPPVQTECRGALLDVHQSSIDPDSTIDLSGLPYHMPMPNLAVFGTAGFPFTRMADLSDTVVTLAPSAQADELAAFLSLMGKMGMETGYPVIGVTVSRETADLQGKDVLMLEVAPYTDLFRRWAKNIPSARMDRASARADGGATAWWDAAAQWLGHKLGRTRPDRSLDPGDTYFTGFESPMERGRSVVAIAASDGARLRNAVELMMFDPEQQIALQGSLASVHGDRIRSLSTSTTYYVGDMGPFQFLTWFLSRYPVVLYLLYVFAAIAIAIVFYLSLRGRAERRLSVEPHSSHSTQKGNANE